MIDLFSIEKIRKSPAKFDIEKLDDINSKYLKNTSVQILLKNFDKKFNEINEEKIKSIEIILPELLKRFKNIKEIEKNLEFIINQRPININEEALNLINDKSIKTLENLSKVLKKLDKWDAYEIEHSITKFFIVEKLNFKDLGLPLRAALVGFLSPLGVNVIIESLGKVEVLDRIEDITKY